MRNEFERERTAALLAGRESLLRQGLGLVEAPVHQRAHPLEQESALEAIAQFGFRGQILALLDVGGDDIAGFEQISNSIKSGFEREIALAGALRDRDHFARVGQPLFEAVGVSQRKTAAPERDDQGVRVVEPFRHLDGLLTKSDGLLTLGPVEFNSQPGQHLGQERTVPSPSISAPRSAAGRGHDRSLRNC